jgi:hypothetical protein
MSTRIACILGLLTAAALCGCTTTPSTRQPAAYRTGSPGFGPSQSVSQDDLTRTGRLDVSAALKTLVPAAH